MKNYIVHHGIIGQKWGVRRYQNLDGSLTSLGRRRYANIMDRQAKKSDHRTTEDELIAKTIPKNVKMRRITTSDEHLSNRPSYVYYTKTDSNNLRGISPTLMGFKGRQSNDAVEKTYKLNEDLKIPSQKEVRSVMNKIAKNKKTRSEIVDSFSSKAPEDFVWMDDDDIDKIIKQLDKKESKMDDLDRRMAKLVLDYSLGDSEIPYQKKVMKELQRRGYNAMYDNAMISADSYNGPEAYEPLIIFDGKKTLSETKKRDKKISYNAAVKYSKRSQKWRDRIW